MTATGGPYGGKMAVLATMHGKERAIAPVLARSLGLSVAVPGGIDTDALGTFTGEIARKGSMLDAANAKARLGMSLTGLPLGIASEGSYGPHPAIPFLPCGIELLVLVDDIREIVVSETLIETTIRFEHAFVGPQDDLSGFLDCAGFPDHALIVRPNEGRDASESAKGIVSRAMLDRAIAEAAARSSDGRAMVQTDMRAHCNPTRMGTIVRLAEKLAQRLASLCPACATPGFGRVAPLPGLPCRWCGGPTTQPAGDLMRCAKCGLERSVPRDDGLTSADPAHCPDCNP